MVGQSAITLVGVIGILFSLHWSVGLIVVAAAVPGAYVRLRYSQRLYRWQRARTIPTGAPGTCTGCSRTARSPRRSASSASASTFRGWFRELRSDAARRAPAPHGTTFAAPISSAGPWPTVAVFGDLRLHRLADAAGQHHPRRHGDVLHRLPAPASTRCSSVLGGVAGLYEDNLFLTYYHEFMALETQGGRGAGAAAGAAADAARHRLRRRDLRLPGHGAHGARGHRPRTSGPARSRALVGANGSGKTTLVKLLCRLYDPQAGRITLDGVDLRELPVADLRRAISVIFQDFVTVPAHRAAEHLGRQRRPARGRARPSRRRPGPPGADEVIGGLAAAGTTRCSASGSRTARS